MSDITTTTNSSPNQPLPKEVKSSAQVINSQEQIEGIDRMGWFDEEPTNKGFDATQGQITFNLPKADFKIEKPVAGNVVSNVSSIFQEGSFVALGAATSAAKAGAGTLKTIFDAVTDTVKNDIVFETPKEQTAEDIKAQQKKMEKEAETQYQNQVMDSTEAEILSIRQKLESQAQLDPLKQEIADLTGLQAMLSGANSLVRADGSVRIDLKDDVEKARKEQIERQSKVTAALQSPAKRGSKGPGMSLDDNKSSETHSTAQTAVG